MTGISARLVAENKILKTLKEVNVLNCLIIPFPSTTSTPFPNIFIFEWNLCRTFIRGRGRGKLLKL